MGERGGRPWESQGEWQGARGAGTPRSGPRCCSGCGISRNLGGRGQKHRRKHEDGGAGGGPNRQRDPEAGKQERDGEKGREGGREREREKQARDRKVSRERVRDRDRETGVRETEGMTETDRHQDGQDRRQRQSDGQRWTKEMKGER